MSSFPFSDWCILFCFQKAFHNIHLSSKWSQDESKFHTCFPYGKLGPRKVKQISYRATKGTLGSQVVIWKSSQNGNDFCFLGLSFLLVLNEIFSKLSVPRRLLLTHVNLESSLTGTDFLQDISVVGGIFIGLPSPHKHSPLLASQVIVDRCHQ